MCITRSILFSDHYYNEKQSKSIIRTCTIHHSHIIFCLAHRERGHYMYTLSVNVTDSHFFQFAFQSVQTTLRQTGESRRENHSHP